MGKKTERPAKKSKKVATKDLPVADSKTRNVKGGLLGTISKGVSTSGIDKGIS